MDVDAVHGERLKAGDLQLPLRHRLLHELKLFLRGLRVGAAAVAGSLQRRPGGAAAAVGVEPVRPARVSGVGDVEEISAPTIRWPVCGSESF